MFPAMHEFLGRLKSLFRRPADDREMPKSLSRSTRRCCFDSYLARGMPEALAGKRREFRRERRWSSSSSAISRSIRRLRNSDFSRPEKLVHRGKQ